MEYFIRINNDFGFEQAFIFSGRHFLKTSITRNNLGREQHKLSACSPLHLPCSPCPLQISDGLEKVWRAATAPFLLVPEDWSSGTKPPCFLGQGPWQRTAGAGFEDATPGTGRQGGLPKQHLQSLHLQPPGAAQRELWGKAGTIWFEKEAGICGRQCASVHSKKCFSYKADLPG